VLSVLGVALPDDSRAETANRDSSVAKKIEEQDNAGAEEVGIPQRESKVGLGEPGSVGDEAGSALYGPQIQKGSGPMKT
jgi:hypothetical protein